MPKLTPLFQAKVKSKNGKTEIGAIGENVANANCFVA
jgi:hypothetical protein